MKEMGGNKMSEPKNREEIEEKYKWKRTKLLKVHLKT